MALRSPDPSAQPVKRHSRVARALLAALFLAALAVVAKAQAPGDLQAALALRPQRRLSRL